MFTEQDVVITLAAQEHAFDHENPFANPLPGS
jgi:hypothetical protein